LIDFISRSTGKAMGDHGIKWRGKTLLDLDYADDLSILEESMKKMNELLKALQVHGARINLKINVKKTRSIRLGISEDEKMMLGSEMIDQVGSFTYLGRVFWANNILKGLNLGTKRSQVSVTGYVAAI